MKTRDSIASIFGGIAFGALLIFIIKGGIEFAAFAACFVLFALLTLFVGKPGVSRSIGERLDRNLTPRAKKKYEALSDEEKDKLASNFARQVGSDTGPISLKNIKPYDDQR